MTPLHVATLTVLRELPKYEHLGSLPYLSTKNETVAPLHVATLRVKRELLRLTINCHYVHVLPLPSHQTLKQVQSDYEKRLKDVEMQREQLLDEMETRESTLINKVKQ